MQHLKDKAAENNAKHRLETENRAAIYHKAFVQSEAGKKILDDWVQRYCMKPIAKSDATAFECGIAEGRRMIVKEVLDHISFVTNKG